MICHIIIAFILFNAGFVLGAAWAARGNQMARDREPDVLGGGVEGFAVHGDGK